MQHGVAAGVGRWSVLAIGLAAIACGPGAAAGRDGTGDGPAEDAEDPQADALEVPACRFEQPFPYSSGSPYLGVHGNRENNNRIFCAGPEAVERGWSALEGRIVFQPISFTADGQRILVTVPRTEGCNLYALHRESGEVAWCSDIFTLGVAAGTVISDDEGYLYLTDGDEDEAWVYKLSERADGVDVVWRTPLTGLYAGPAPATYLAPAGLHFSPGGHVVTATPDGVVVLVDRDGGELVDTFDVRSQTGFVPSPGEGIPVALVPPAVRARLDAAIGEMTDEELEAAFGSSLGGSGGYSDNTVAVSALGQVFLVGGGPPETGLGAVVALDIEADGTAEARLGHAWDLFLVAGSATSPAISPDGTRMVVGDGGEGEAGASLVYADIAACNDDTDADPDPGVCAPMWLYPLLGKPILASPGIDEHGAVYAWHASMEPGDVDLVALDDLGGAWSERWVVRFSSPDTYDRQWTSSATVMDDVVVGGLTSFVEPAFAHLDLPIFEDLYHEIVAVDRETGDVVWREDMQDDSVNSIAPGPDGALYVPVMGMFDLLASGEHVTFTGGVVRYVPR